MNRPLAASLCVLVAISFVLTGLTVLVNGGSGDDSLLPTFSNEFQLDNYLKTGSYYSDSFSNKNRETSATPTSAADSAARYSTTNIQVFGVDEMDIVKTDGQYLYLVSSDSVSIVKAYPPTELGNVSKIDAVSLGLAQNGVYISGIFLLPSKLVVVYTVSENNNYDSAMQYWRPWTQKTMAAIFDVSNPYQPKLEGACGVSGYLVAARMIDDRVYLITQEYVFWLEQEAKLPASYDGNDSKEVTAQEIRYDPQCADPSSFVNLFSLNVSTQEAKCQTIVAGYSSVVYVSHSSIYLTFQNGGYAVPVMALDALPDPQITTTIFRLDIHGLDINCTAKGEVAGWLLNQFSMDEKDGYLRLATTTSWTKPENDVFVLDGDLNTVGSIVGLAPSERIYSARFLDDMLYLVTFRQIDPLFAVDLSEVHHPQVIGELKIAGVSNYLHPYGSDRLIGIGFENSSVKISLFDISNPVDPLEVQTLRLENYSYSLAQYDSHAVLFDDLTGLLVIPVWEYNAIGYWSVTSAAYVFEVSHDGMALKGSITHGPQNLTSYMYYIQRSVFIDDFLYTISDSMVKVSSLADLSEVGEIVYHQSYPYYVADGGVK